MMNEDYQNLISETLTFLGYSQNKRESLLVTLEIYDFFKKAHQEKKPLPPRVNTLIKPEPAVFPRSFKEDAPSAALTEIKELKSVPKKEKPLIETPLEMKEEAKTPELLPLRKLVSEIAPAFTLHDSPLDDTEAKKMATLYKEEKICAEVALIYFGEDKKEKEFLNNLAQAISVVLRPAKLIDGKKIEKEQKWASFLESKNLQWIIAPKRGLRYSSELITYYKEMPATQERFLGKIPIIFLETLPEYFKNPRLKRELWQTLLTTLKIEKTEV